MCSDIHSSSVLLSVKRQNSLHVNKPQSSGPAESPEGASFQDSFSHLRKQFQFHGPAHLLFSLKSAKEKKEAIPRDNSEFVIYFLPKMTSKVNLSQFQEAKKNLSVPSQSILLVTFHLSSKTFLSLLSLQPCPWRNRLQSIKSY